MKKLILLTLCTLTLTLTAIAQKEGNVQVPVNSKIYIAEMTGDLHTFLAAAMMKAKLPIRIVTDDKEADFILSGSSLKGDDKWFNSAFGGKDKNEGSAQLVSVKDKTLVWAGEAGDRSMLLGGLKKGGQRKVAERLIKQMKKDLFK